MPTPNQPRKGYELHRAVVQSADPVTGITQVKIPDLLGQSIVDVHWAGLEKVGGLYQTPNVGDMSLVAVSNDGTQIMWVLSADHSALWNGVEAAAASGVLSIAGTSNQISTSASVGNVTLSLPQNIHTAATPTFAEIKLSGAAGSFRTAKWQTAGVLRWQMYADNVAESGSNAGSNLVLARHDDAGTSLGTVLTINRASGTMALTGTVTFPNTTSVGLSNVAGTSYFHLDRSSGNSQWLTKSGASSFIDADTFTVRESAGTTNRLLVNSTTVTSPNTLTLTRATGPHISIAPTDTAGASQWVTFGAIGNALGAPSLSARSVGTRAIFFDNFVGSSFTDYAIGMEGSNLWFSVPANTGGFGFKWYGGATQWMSLNNANLTVNTGSVTVSAGNLTITAGTITAGSTIQGTRLISTVATGTAPLTVTSTTMVTNLNAQFLGGASRCDNVVTTSFTARTTSGTAITAAMATLTLPAQTSAGKWFFFLKFILSKTVATDAFDIGVSADGGTSYIALTRTTQESGLSVYVHGYAATAAGAGDTITAHMNRQAGTGTGTNGTGDSRFHMFGAHFVPD